MVEYSEEGEKISNAFVSGATGMVENIMGKAIIPQMKMGNLIINDINITVLKDFPDKFKEYGISGIIGMDILKQAVEEVGARNFDSQALYDAAITWQFEYEGIPDFHFYTQSVRIPANFYAVMEVSAEEQDLFRMHEDWLPKINSLE